MTIKKTVRATLVNVICKFLNKVGGQHLWEKTFRVSLREMNIGTGGNFNHSGELLVAKFILEKFNKESQIIILMLEQTLVIIQNHYQLFLAIKLKYSHLNPLRKHSNCL